MMTRTLWAVAAALTLGSSAYAVAPGDTVANFSIRGTVPAIVSTPDMGGLEGGGEVQPFGTIDETHFDQGFVDANAANRIQIQGLSANVPVTLRIQNNGWDLPAGYDTVNGPKSDDGSDSDFSIFVDPANVSAARGAISALGTFGTQFTPVTNTPADMLQLGSAPGSGTRIGVKNGEAYVTPRMNLDSVYDIPGDYIVYLEMTVSFTLP